MIRPCRPADLDTMYAIINDAARAYKGVIPSDCRHEPYMPRDELLEQIRQGVAFWGYEQDGALMGVMGLQDVRDVTLIRHAYVQTVNRSQGIGSRLLAFLRTRATHPILIGAWAAAEWAIRFYEKHGFTLVSTQEKDRLLPAYWRISRRQVETSVVLVESGESGGPSTSRQSSMRR